MIFLFAALHPEAETVRKRLLLKQEQDMLPFPLFIDAEEQTILTITGVGRLEAAIAVSSVLTRFSAGKGDMLLHFGSSSYVGREPESRGESLYSLHRLTDLPTGRSFYPDMCYDLSLPESSSVTGDRLLRSEDNALKSRILSCSLSESTLYDMESAAVFRAASHFLGPAQQIYLRYPVDFAAGESVSPERLRLCSESCAPKICEIVGFLRERENQALPGPSAEAAVFERLKEDFHCSRNMEVQLRQLLHYLYLREEWLRKASASSKMLASSQEYFLLERYIEELYEAGFLPAKDRKAGKEILQKIRKQY